MRWPRILHFKIRAPQIFERAVFQIAHEVAGTIQARSGPLAERVGNKPLGGQSGLAAVTPGQARTLHAEFAGHAQRGGTQAFVQDKDLGVGDGPANRYEPVATFLFIGVAVRRIIEFGAAIDIPHLHPGQFHLHLGAQSLGQRLAGGQAVLWRRSQGRSVLTGQERLRRCEGTMLSRVTFQRRSACANALVSFTASSAMNTWGVPLRSPARSSFTEMEKAATVFWATISPGPKGRRSHMACSQFKICRWATIAPLGRPVEPDVYIT